MFRNRNRNKKLQYEVSYLTVYSFDSLIVEALSHTLTFYTDTQPLMQGAFRVQRTQTFSVCSVFSLSRTECNMTETPNCLARTEHGNHWKPLVPPNGH